MKVTHAQLTPYRLPFARPLITAAARMSAREGWWGELTDEAGRFRIVFRLGGLRHVFASPVGAANRVYLTGGNGATLVIKHGPQFEVLAQNVLDSGFTASPAIVGSEIYLRGYKYRYCIAAD